MHKLLPRSFPVSRTVHNEAEQVSHTLANKSTVPNLTSVIDFPTSQTPLHILVPSQRPRCAKAQSFRIQAAHQQGQANTEEEQEGKLSFRPF
jgi:hypothetical protein